MAARFAGRRAVYAVAGAAVAAAALSAYLLRSDHPDFDTPARVMVDERLKHPSDIVRFKGRYVAAELYGNRLAVFDDLGLDGIEYFDPGAIGKKFRAPHYLAVTPRDTLLVSNGWGSSIVEIADLDGTGWKEFSGRDGGFDAPHGICVDDQGWIYVGDSLNSRLVRFRDMDGGGWQVFADVDDQVSYIRELHCQLGAVWASNSYEKRPGLNPGEGGNVLKITDFESGRAEVLASFPDTNITGLLPLSETEALVGQWGLRRRLALVNASDDSTEVFPRLELGTPYGIFLDRRTGHVLVAHIGNLSNESQPNIGGLALYR